MHGRAGRENLPGKVIIQTYNPNSFPIELSKEQNYDLFYNTEIKLRQQLKYPPFCDIILIGFYGENEKTFQILTQVARKSWKGKFIWKSYNSNI